MFIIIVMLKEAFGASCEHWEKGWDGTVHPLHPLSIFVVQTNP